jgi:exonuclease III
MINVCTLNVNWMHSKEKSLRVIEYLKRNKSSIAFLQETYWDKTLQNKIECDSNYFTCCYHGTTPSRGVAILR